MKDLIERVKELIKKGWSEAIKWAIRTLMYFRINDEKNNVSLTNLAMMIVMYKMLVTQATSWQDMAALSIAILGYQAKRAIENKK